MRGAMSNFFKYIFVVLIGVFRLAVGQDNCGGIKLTAGLQTLLGNIPLAQQSSPIAGLGCLPSLPEFPVSDCSLPEFPTSDCLPPLPALEECPCSSSEYNGLPSLDCPPPPLPAPECSPDFPSPPPPPPPYDYQTCQPLYPCADVKKPCCLSKCPSCCFPKFLCPILPPCPLLPKCGGVCCPKKLCKPLPCCCKKKLSPLLAALLLKKGLTLGLDANCNCCGDLPALPTNLGSSLTGILNQQFEFD